MYEYKCDKCGGITERIYKMSRKKPATTKCDHCDKGRARRQFAGIGFKIDASTGGTSFKPSVGV